MCSCEKWQFSSSFVFYTEFLLVLSVCNEQVLAVATKGVPMADVDPGIHIPSRTVGQLEIHGKKRLRTWTKLAETATAGSG